MNMIDNILDFGMRVYEETGAIPVRIVLPLAVHDRLKADCARRISQKPSVVPGTISCIKIETGYGTIDVLTDGPEQAAPMPSQTEEPLHICTQCKDTHRAPSSGNMCTSCPRPCEECRSRGPGRAGGPYCASTPCGCSCHSDSEQYRRVHRETLRRSRAEAPSSREAEAEEAFAVVRDIRTVIDRASAMQSRQSLLNNIMAVLDATDIGAFGARRHAAPFTRQAAETDMKSVAKETK